MAISCTSNVSASIKEEGGICNTVIVTYGITFSDCSIFSKVETCPTQAFIIVITGNKWALIGQGSGIFEAIVIRRDRLETLLTHQLLAV